MERVTTGCLPPDIEMLRREYLQGRCMVLAVCLSCRFVAPLVGVYDRTWVRIPRHVGVQVEDGRYADARGQGLDQMDFLAGYGDESSEIRQIDEASVRRIWGWRISSWEVPDEHLWALGLDQRSLAA